MALPRFTPDIDILYLLPDGDREAHAIRLMLRALDYESVYRTRRGDIWQLETHIAPHLVMRHLQARGLNVIEITHDEKGGSPRHVVRFARPYAGDSDMPWEHYHPRPAGMPVYPWDAPKMPSPNEHDVVAGPLGIAPITEPEDIPAALEATGLIPVPGVPGLDYTYAEMGMIEPDDEPEPPPAARAAMSIALARHIVNATARQRLVGPDKGCTAARNRLPLTHTVSGDAFHYNTERGKGQAA